MMEDDDWAVFAVDPIRQPDAKHPDSYFVWVGTNHPVINELVCQRLRRDTWPFDPEHFGLARCNWEGLFFSVTADYYRSWGDGTIRDLAAPFKMAAQDQGYELQVMEPYPNSLPGLLHYPLRATARMRRDPSSIGSFGGSGDEDEEE